MFQENWFTSRDLRVLNYQKECFQKVNENWEKRNISVLAAAPSAGKTIMSVYLIDEFLKNNPNSKVLILAHGTTILRTQYFDVLNSIKPDFTYKLVESYKEYDSSNTVNVTLPQTITGKEIENVDLLVVDEAHQFYYAKMMKEIIKRCKPKKQLLLTGTPSPFIRKGLPIIPITLNRIFDEGMVSDLNVELCTSSYDFDINRDYNNNLELKEQVKITKEATVKTLDSLIDQIVVKLNKSKANQFTNFIPDWVVTLKKLKKTMFACRSQQQALQVSKYFESKGIKTALSTSNEDYKSEEIQRFMNQEDCLVLIVVNRGILGFNYPELVNIVDMTTSQNIDRIYQLLCRVTRKHPEGYGKLFIKIAPNIHSDYYKYIMTAVLSLTEEEFFTKFNGRNFNQMMIPVIKKSHKRNETNNSDNVQTNTKKTTIKPINFEGLPVLNFFKDIYHKKNALLHTYAFTDMNTVRGEFMEYKPNGYWAKERCVEDALKYNTISDWIKNNSGAYQAALRNKWINECTKHMDLSKKYIVTIKKHTKENCIKSAKKYNTIMDWRKHENNFYDAAKRHKWIDVCTKHIKKPIKHTKENCIKSAKKYNTIMDWYNNEKPLYYYANRNDFLDECTKHMERNAHKKYTKEEIFESAKKYITIKDWNENEPKLVKAARRKNYYNECTKHMKKPKRKKYWSVEKILNTIKKYKKYSEWYINESRAYDAAKNYNILNKIKQEFEKGK